MYGHKYLIHIHLSPFMYSFEKNGLEIATELKCTVLVLPVLQFTQEHCDRARP